MANPPDLTVAAYFDHACNRRPSIALALLAYWERPWSGQLQRFAYHALRRAMTRGLDVLESLP